MRLSLDQVEERVKHLRYLEDAVELNERLRCGAAEFHVPHGITVELQYYRAGGDVYLEAALSGEIRGTCARCAEDFTFAMGTDLRAVLSPRGTQPGHAGSEEAEDLGLGFYEGDEIDITALVYEHALLALPTRAVCTEACRGLCMRCGANLNTGSCSCPHEAVGIRFRTGLVSRRPA